MPQALEAGKSALIGRLGDFEPVPVSQPNPRKRKPIKATQYFKKSICFLLSMLTVYRRQYCMYLEINRYLKIETLNTTKHQSEITDISRPRLRDVSFLVF